jgi:hypothetical protein
MDEFFSQGRGTDSWIVLMKNSFYRFRAISNRHQHVFSRFFIFQLPMY